MNHLEERSKERFFKKIKPKIRKTIVNKIKKGKLKIIRSFPDRESAIFELYLDGSLIHVVYSFKYEDLVTVMYPKQKYMRSFKEKKRKLVDKKFKSS